MTVVVPKALTIAGSDSGGGAGIQADLKTFLALGVYGTSVVTAITAQNTLGVQGVWELSSECVGLQIDAVLSDIGADSAKTGMLATGAIVDVVSRKLRDYRLRSLVVDPVMVAKGGHHLLQPEARRALVEALLPLALVITPNVAEAALLTDIEVRNRSSMEEAAKRLKAMGPAYVVVKGGHLPEDAVDILYDGCRYREYRSPRIVTHNTHGAGCTFAAAIAAELAKGMVVEEAVAVAKKFVTAAISASLSVGQGHGPLNHRVIL